LADDRADLEKFSDRINIRGEKRYTAASTDMRAIDGPPVASQTAAAPIIHPGRDPTVTRIPLNQAQAQSDNLQERLEMSTAEIGLAVRTTNCLEERGVFTVHDLLHCTRDDLLSISNFGEKTLEEVYKALESIGFFRPEKRSAK